MLVFGQFFSSLLCLTDRLIHLLQYIIIYFTFSFTVHQDSSFLIALEWNPSITCCIKHLCKVGHVFMQTLGR